MSSVIENGFFRINFLLCLFYVMMCYLVVKLKQVL